MLAFPSGIFLIYRSSFGIQDTLLIFFQEQLVEECSFDGVYNLRNDGHKFYAAHFFKLGNQSSKLFLNNRAGPLQPLILFVCAKFSF